MSDGPLPHTVNTRKAVTLEARYSGTLKAANLSRLSDVLLDDGGDAVSAQIQFARDDEGRQIVLVEVAAVVLLECQRCLERFRQPVDSSSELAIVRTDEEAKQLPPRYEPLLAGEETDLWEIVGEELALALPVAALHPEGECPVVLPSATPDEIGSEQALENDSGAARRKPFDVLSTLLDDDSSK